MRSSNRIGQILNATSKPAEALKHFQKALNLSPDFAEAALAVGKIRVQAKQYSESGCGRGRAQEYCSHRTHSGGMVAHPEVVPK